MASRSAQGIAPFPLPEGARCQYGDIRDRAALNKYFANDRISLTGHVDAQTYAGVAPASLDFVISAHVIEHLFDPIGAIRAAVSMLKPRGVFLCVVPDMEKTWDRQDHRRRWIIFGPTAGTAGSQPVCRLTSNMCDMFIPS